MRNAITLAVMLVATVLAGCASDDEGPKEPEFTAPPSYQPGQITNVTERITLPFNTTLPWSQVLEAGPFGILDGLSVYVPITLPATEGGSAVIPTEEPLVHLGVFLPDIPGCDWTATSLPAECNVPVIADAGPYYTDSDVDAEDRGSGRLGEFLITNFVPHGYAVAQVSVFGSGKSNHCFDMFGLAEQLGVHGAVKWLGSQPWSNGNVGLIGRSYDGSTPWMAAAHASEGSALKTIVPISGLTGLQDLVTWNGASEDRILTFQNVVYGTFGLTPGADPEFGMQVLRRASCPDWVTATPWGAAGYVSGDSVLDVEGTYWQERSMLPRVLENYRGSLYMIHGLQDNNVDPHAGWIGHKLLEDGGWDTKGLWGQWYHSYPDRPGEHGGENQQPQNSVRYDFAQDLLEWFDYYLMGTGAKPSLHVEVQTVDGRWRIDDKLQPTGSEIRSVALPAGSTQVRPAGGGVTIDLGVLDANNETILGGFSTARLSLTPSGPGGQVYVELIDLDGDDFNLAYGIMELRQSGQTPVPNMPVTVDIPIQYFSAALPAGHRLGMEIAGSGNDFLPSPVVAPVTVNHAGSSVEVSIVHPSAASWFEPPLWMVEEEVEPAP